MQEHPRRFPVGIVIGLSTLVVATGSATAFFTWQNAQKSQPVPVAVEPPQVNAPQSAPPVSQNSIQAPKTEKTAQVYWLKDSATEPSVVSVPVKAKSGDREEAVLTAAMNTLLSEPPKDTTSEIPKGTTLRSLKVKSDAVYVDLSKAFVSGGGSFSMTGRLGQVLYTATSVNPSAKVYLSVEGEPLTVLGGEGLIVDQPLTRSQFEQDQKANQE